MELKNIKKEYTLKNSTKVFSLNNINVKFKPGKFYGIIGHSGSGKSTLINIIGLIDNYDSGEYYIDKVEVSNLSEEKKAHLRLSKFGFVFQAFYLNAKLSALDNVILPMLINQKILKSERRKKAIDLLSELGLEDRIDYFPNQLSGGEQQRVAIARALANDPEVIIADEPTGNLDSKSEKQVFDILKKLCKENGKTIIVVTHNDIIKKYADVIFKMDNGSLSLEVSHENKG